MERKELSFYEETARKVRLDIIRETFNAGSGHPGGSLSCADILTALYFGEMNIDPADPKMKGRDRFVLSKGHAVPAQYAVLAERGYFPVSDIMTLRKLGSPFQGHGNMRKVPGIEMSTGSLGQGFSASVGMALADRLDNNGARVYALLGDGEIQEGIVWEAAMSAAHYGLSSLTAIVNWNGLQIDGRNDDVMKVTPIKEKFEAFGWHVIEIDGHDFSQIFDALDAARAEKEKPTAIIAKTVKGKGVSYMEDQAGRHGKAPSEEEAMQAVKELGGEW